MKKVSEMTKKELISELISVEEHIENCSYGRYELMYQSEIYKELDKRGIELQRHTSYT